ncbi:MAG: hypothetical protein OXM55_04570, partial [Bdellovibrionales bacterium]|nr:hypothetical protein [Bdellovibrionales bacterium]
IGEAGLPLLERGFETGDQDLQKEALRSASLMGEASIPVLKRVLKNKNLTEKIKIDIRKLLNKWN